MKKENKEKKRTVRLKLTHLERKETDEENKLAAIERKQMQIADRQNEANRKITELDQQIENLTREKNEVRNMMRLDTEENARLEVQKEEALKKKSEINEQILIEDQKYDQMKENENACKHLNREIKKIEDFLECPICNYVATAPIFKCPNDHLLCR